jgi:4-amino-4-deoxy-L-arabinose transferase-like glycosyltransferase
MAHIEDEMAYLWQAKVIAHGVISIPSPPEPKSFLYPFVVDYQGQRFGKYPLPWPVVLSFGVHLGAIYLVNPILAGLGLWLIYRLGKRLFGEPVSLLASALMLSSPFFLLNSGSLLAHPFGLVLSAAFALAWIDGFCEPTNSHPWIPTLVSGSTIGVLALARPLTAIAVGLPFGLHGLYLLIRSDWSKRQRLLLLGTIALLLVSLHFIWQYAVTGDALLNPYTLWWEYDKVGFGPGYGRIAGGHTLDQAWTNTKFSLYVGQRDLFGWGSYSWIFLPFGLFAIIRDRNWRALLPILTLPCLVIAYMAYWIGSSLFGPRYYFEALYSLTLLTSAGIALLAGWPTLPDRSFPNYTGWRRIRALAIAGLIVMLITTNLIFYTPLRLEGMYGLYGVQHSHLAPFISPESKEFTPALVIVHTSGKWIEYGTLLELEDPFLSTPYIFAISRGLRKDIEVASYFPARNVYHYYPSVEPYILYDAPLPTP